MTRGAAANAILDAGRSKKRSFSFPLCPVPSTRALSFSLFLSLAPFHLFFLLCLSLPLFSSRFSATLLGGLSLSFFLSPQASSFFFLHPSSLLSLGTLLSPPTYRRSPRGFPLSSLLMPRDRQMMIKKAPVRVRTTPRRLVPPPASLLVLHRLFLLLLFLLLLLLLPLLNLRQFFFLFSSLDSLHCTLLPLLLDSRGFSLSLSLSLSLSFFFPLLDFRSFVPSFLVCSPSLFTSPRNFFPSPQASLSCGYTFVACIIVRRECLRVVCPLFVTDRFAEGRY